jgi:hypothetical protein
MVYDSMRSGLNNAIWVPRFLLPTVNTMIRAGDENTFMVDMDIGEMFLNLCCTSPCRLCVGLT